MPTVESDAYSDDGSIGDIADQAPPATIRSNEVLPIATTSPALAEDNAAGTCLCVIVNFIPPYKYELASILGALAGSKTRFRFQSKYVQPSTLAIDGMAKPKVLICMRNRDTGGIIPVRLGKMQRGRWIAGIAVLDVVLQELATLPTLKDERKQHLQRFSSIMDQEMQGFDTSGGQDLTKLVFLSSHFEAFIHEIDSAVDSNDTRWANLLSEIEDQFSDPGVDFVLVSGPTTSRQRPIATTSEGGERGMALTQGEQYHFEITQRTHTGKKGDSTVNTESAVILSSESPDILIPQPRYPIKGKYSDIEAYFSVSKDARPGPRHMALLVTRSGDNPIEYEMEIPVVITRSKLQTWIAVGSLILFIFGFVAYLLPDTAIVVLEALGKILSLGGPPSSGTIEKAAVVVMIVASTGNPLTRFLSDRFKVG